MATMAIATGNCISPSSQADAYNALNNAFRILKDRYNKINTEHQIMSRVLHQLLTEEQMKEFLSLYTQTLSTKYSSLKSHPSFGKYSNIGHSSDFSPPAPVPAARFRGKTSMNQNSDSQSTNQSNDNKSNDSSDRRPSNVDTQHAFNQRDTADENAITNNSKLSRETIERIPVIIDKGLQAGTKTDQCSITDVLKDPVERIHTVKPDDDIKNIKSTLRELIHLSEKQSTMLKNTRSMLEQQQAALRKLVTTNQHQQLLDSMDHLQPHEEDWTLLSSSSS